MCRLRLRMYSFLIFENSNTINSLCDIINYSLYLLELILLVVHVTEFTLRNWRVFWKDSLYGFAITVHLFRFSSKREIFTTELVIFVCTSLVDKVYLPWTQSDLMRGEVERCGVMAYLKHLRWSTPLFPETSTLSNF